MGRQELLPPLKPRHTAGPAKGHSNNKMGRPQGAATRVTREIANRLAEDGGVLALEVMADNYRWGYDLSRSMTDKLQAMASKVLAEADKQKRQKELAAIRKLLNATLEIRTFAQMCARDAAGYQHPRLASISLENQDGRPFVLQLAAGLEEL